MGPLNKYIIGLLYALLLAGMSFLLSNLSIWPLTLSNGSHPIEPVMMALLLGLIINFFFPTPQSCIFGLRFSSRSLLHLSIILLGAKLSIQMIWHQSMALIVMILLSVFVGLVVMMLLGRMIGVRGRLSILLAMGTSICGSAAIAGTAPVIGATDEEIGLSLTIINLLGLIAVFVFPLLSAVLSLAPASAGIWMGLSIQAVAQVAAAAFSCSVTAGNMAVMVKLARVLCLGPMLLILGFVCRQSERETASHLPRVWQTVLPPFIVFFILLMFVNSMGWLIDFHVFGGVLHTRVVLGEASGFLMVMALGAIGLLTDIRRLFSSSLRPFCLAGIGALVLALFTYVLVLYY